MAERWGTDLQAPLPDAASSSIVRDAAPSGNGAGFYGFAELEEALAAGRIVFIARTVEDVQRLAALGIPATCPVGAINHVADETIEAFARADLVLVRDSDPWWRDAAHLLAIRCYGTAARVRILDLARFADAGGRFGLTDWIERGADAELLYRMVEDTPDLFGHVGAEINAPADQAEYLPKVPWRSKFGAYTWGEPRNALPKYEYDIKGILPAREKCAIVGKTQSGKSFFTFDMAMALARGIDYRADRPRKVKPGLVIYCAAEAGTGFVDRRLPAYAQHHGLALDQRLPFVVLTVKFDLFGNQQQVDDLIVEIKHHAAQFDVPLRRVVIDTLNKTTPGMDEISGKDVGIVLKRLDNICEECGCGLDLVHHLNAAGTGARGHTSLVAAFDTLIIIARDERKDADGRALRKARLEKQREGEDGIEWEFVLRQVALGTDEDGDKITSTVVDRPAGERNAAEDNGQPERGFQIKTANGRLMFGYLLDTLSDLGRRAPKGVKAPEGAVVCTIDEWRETVRRKAPIVEHDPKKKLERTRKAVQRALEKFVEFRLAGIDNEYVWWTGREVAGFRPSWSLAPKEVVSATVDAGSLAGGPDDELPFA